MRIVIADDYKAMSRMAADEIEELVASDPSCVLGLATGSTPLGLYAELASDFEAGKTSFKDVTTFNLDEYCGLGADNPQGYRYFMNENLFDKVDVAEPSTHVPEGRSGDLDAECARYDKMIDEAGGIDLQLLGLGHNGHIGFNEPCDEFPKGTHVVDLTESTINANSRLFDSADEVPRQAITMGIGTIMAARRVLVVASGADKASIVKKAFLGPVTPEVPASILQFHPNALVIVDEEAAAELV